MGYDLPDAPAFGQSVTTPGGTYYWDGFKWAPVPASTPVGGYVTSFNTRIGVVTLNASDVSGASGLLRTGGAMTGVLTLSADPAAPLQAATKAYVDAHVSTAGVSSFNTRTGAVTLGASDVSGAGGLLTAGGTLTGSLTLAGDPAAALQPVTLQYLQSHTPTALPPSGAAGGDLTGTYPSPSLATVAGVAGSYTSANIVVDSKGRVTSASNGTGGTSFDPHSPPAVGDVTPNTMDATRIILHGASPGQSISAGIGNGYWCGGNVTLTDNSSGGAFVGSISGTTLTVTSISAGTNLGYAIYVTGSGVTQTMITAQTSGTTGGVGVYTVDVSQTVSSRTMTGYTYATAWAGSVNENRAGSQGFGLFSINALTTTGTIVNEFDVANNSGVDANSAPFPPAQSFGTSDHIGIGLQLVSNGNHRSTVGLQVIGKSPTTNFQRGIYMWPGACNAFGIMVDATSSDTLTAAAYFRCQTAGTALGLQTKGSTAPNNVVFVVNNDAQSAVAQITQSGAYSGGNVLPMVDNTSFCGYSGNRWSQVWASTGTIQTSDPEMKTDVATLREREVDALAVVNAIDPVMYRFKVGGKREIAVTREEMVQEYRIHSVDGHPQCEYLTNDDGSPKMVPQTVHDREFVDVPGKRLHWGFMAPDLKRTFDELGLDWGGYVQGEDGSHNLRPDQLIPILWRAIQQLAAKVK